MKIKSIVVAFQITFFNPLLLNNEPFASSPVAINGHESILICDFFIKTFVTASSFPQRKETIELRLKPTYSKLYLLLQIILIRKKKYIKYQYYLSLFYSL